MPSLLLKKRGIALAPSLPALPPSSRLRARAMALAALMTARVEKRRSPLRAHACIISVKSSLAGTSRRSCAPAGNIKLAGGLLPRRGVGSSGRAIAHLQPAARLLSCRVVTMLSCRRRSAPARACHQKCDVLASARDQYPTSALAVE